VLLTLVPDPLRWSVGDPHCASVTNAMNATPITFSTSSHVTDNIVRAGVNYK
jgi:hypothetical protein